MGIISAEDSLSLRLSKIIYHETYVVEFFSSSKDRIEQAKEDWKSGRLAPVPGESELIPLPGPKPTPVNHR